MKQRAKEKIDPTHFIVFEAPDKAEIYYEDMQLFVVYRQDAAGFGSIGACAGDYVEKLRIWAEKVNEKSKLQK